MERLPYIDSHARLIQATPERVWSSLIETLRKRLAGINPTLSARTLGLEQATVRGDWAGDVQVGDTLPGFAVAEVRAPERLALRGRHRFSSYALTFELESNGAGCTLTAHTSAAFPGLLGRGYRMLVIGSRGHRVVVRALLAEVARRV